MMIRFAIILVLLPTISIAQEGLTTVQSLIIGDPYRSTDQVIEFGFNAVVGIASIDKGCTITVNPGAPVITTFACITAGSPTISIKGISDDGSYSPLSPTMTAQLPFLLWTNTFSARCKCPAGNFIAISEMQRP